MIKHVTWQKDPFEITFKGVREDGTEYEYHTQSAMNAIETMAQELNKRSVVDEEIDRRIAGLEKQTADISEGVENLLEMRESLLHTVFQTWCYLGKYTNDADDATHAKRLLQNCLMARGSDKVKAHVKTVLLMDPPPLSPLLAHIGQLLTENAVLTAERDAWQKKAQDRDNDAEGAYHQGRLAGKRCDICVTDDCLSAGKTCFPFEAPPPWRKEPPDEQALWWWWNEDGPPVVVNIFASGHGENTRYFATAEQHGWSHPQWVEHMGGWWMRCVEPEVPREGREQ